MGRQASTSEDISTAIHSGLLTAEEFAALPCDGLRLELVRGELVAMAPAVADHGEVVGALHAELGYYIRHHQLGTKFPQIGLHKSVIADLTCPVLYVTLKVHPRGGDEATSPIP